MNPCAASFRPGDVYRDAPREATGRDLYVKKNPPGLASMTPPDEHIQESPFTQPGEILIPGKKLSEDKNQSPLGHKHQASYKDAGRPILPSPAGSLSKNGFASTASSLDFTSDSRHRSNLSEKIRDIHLSKRSSTPSLAKNHILAGHSSLTTSATIPTSPPNTVSSNKLLFRSENQQPRSEALPFNPIDKAIEFQGSVFQPELYAPYDQEKLYIQQDPQIFGLPWPFLFEQTVFQPSTQTAVPLLDPGILNPFFTEAPPNFEFKAKSKPNPPLFGRKQPGETSSQSLLAGSQGVIRPRYKLVGTAPNHPRSWQDKKPRVSTLVDSAKARKAMEYTRAPSPAQESILLEDKDTEEVLDLPLSTHPVTFQQPRPQLGDGIANTVNLLMLQRQPPANAPTAPASFRRSKPAAQRASSLSAQPADTGTWSQSKRWVSKETIERAAFQKMKLHLQYMGADKSPAVPQTPADLAAFRLETTSIKTRKLTKDIFKREELSQRKKEAQGEDATKLQPKLVLFNNKTFGDALSPFFAAESWFNKAQPGGHEAQARWPTMADFKEDGDHRAPRHGRYFPLPRIPIATFPTRDHSNGEISSLDTGMKQEKGAVKCDARFILPLSHTTEGPEDEPDNFPEDSGLARVPPCFYQLLEYIENEFKDEEETEDFK
jgi:hypothetical protein